MVKLIANRSMRYAGRRVIAGDVFDAKPRDARILIAVKRADPYVERPVQRAAPVAPPAEPPVVESPAAEAPAPDAPTASEEPKAPAKPAAARTKGKA